MPSARPLAFAVLALAACGRPKPVDVQPEPPPASSVPDALPAPEASSEPASAVRAPTPVPSEPAPFPWPEGYAPPEVWETRQVTVDGAVETWSLRWREPPRFNGCSPWSYCGCEGVEWGLQGDLELVRERSGAPVERLDLAKLREGGAQIPGFLRTSLDEDKYDRVGRLVRPGKRLSDAVRRPHVQVLNLRDYDHDGWATEFVFQVGYWACGQNPSVLVGVSRANPHLHVLGTAEAPERWLVMTYLSSWDQILAARGKTVEVAQHVCGDHGGGGHYTTLRFDPSGLRVVDDADWQCDFDHLPPRRTVRIPPEAEGDPSAGSDAGTTL
jgi:hypothetical protein